MALVMDEESYATAADERPEDPALRGTRMIKMGVAVTDDTKEPRGDALTLPESTHSFLFTEPLCSVPFQFGVGIAVMSYMCLALALINNLTKGKVPTNVDISVRIAQYLSILIALLMEEEIPTGLYLLRRIPKQYLKSKCPEISYPRFVGSSLLRISMGYLFLVNVVIVLIQADEVIMIFYDVLALQFIQKLDDIGFSISKMDVLGKRMQRATMTPYFHIDFQKQKESLGHNRRVKVLLKATYFINFVGFLSALIVISIRQTRGYYQCDSIDVRFGDEVWQDAIVQWPSYSKQYPPGLIEELVLAYSYFNGSYEKDPGQTHEGRPIYIEMKKSDQTPFDESAPPYDPYHPGMTPDAIKPATIKYCGGHWIFQHDFVLKSMKDQTEEPECNWLARSPATESFDLLDVEGKWEVWTGAIREADVSIKCNGCEDDADCNLNGVCNDQGRCDCDVENGAVYLGTHCEVKLKDACRTIIGEQYNDIWTVGNASELFTDIDAVGGSGEIFQEYNRPVYSYVKGLPESQAPGEGDSFSLIYSGSRWFRIGLALAHDEAASDFWAWMTTNYHGFWARAYSPGITTLVSEPTYNDNPVGVDFYHVGEFGDQFGPFGVLYPAQKHNVTGRGVYRCDQKFCPFCPDGLTADEDFVIPNDRSSPKAAGYTCRFFADYAKTLEEEHYTCKEVQVAEEYCCPP